MARNVNQCVLCLFYCDNGRVFVFYFTELFYALTFIYFTLIRCFELCFINLFSCDLCVVRVCNDCEQQMEKNEGDDEDE